MARAFVCPGQGAQFIGMGRDLAKSFPVAREVFQEVDDALSQSLSQLMWEGEIGYLTLTENAQPALMANSLAVARVLDSEGFGVETADFVAGHSLGEYSALAIAGAVSVGDAAKLLRTRGKAMQAAVPIGIGAMAALIGLDFETVSKVAKEAAEYEVCEAANDNDPAQVVVSGHKGAVDRAIKLAKEYGAKRAVLLPVSAPFHCSLMAHAKEVMEKALLETKFQTPKVPLVANVLAEAVSNPDTIKKLLVKQITGAVRWRESVIWMVENGVSEIWELGAGRALSGMVRRIEKKLMCRAFATPEDIELLSS